MHHAWEVEVVDEARAAEDLLWQVDARHGGCVVAQRGERLGSRLASGVDIEQMFVGDVPVARAGIAGGGYRSVLDAECGRGTAEARRGAGEEDGADLGAGLAQRGA